MDLIKTIRPSPLISTLFLIFCVSGTPAAFAAGCLDTLQAGQWCDVPNSHMSSVVPNPPPPGATGPSAIMDAWSGGAYDSKRDRFIVWGGGHSDYAGNEIYAFDINTLSWLRLNNPSTDVGGDESSGYYPDGKPRSRHTYDYVEYVASIDRFCSFAGAGLYPSGQIGIDNVDCFNFDTLGWERKANTPSLGNAISAMAAYDSASAKVFFQTTQSSSTLASYNPVSNNWQVHNSSGWMNYYLTAAVDPVRRKMVAIGGGQQLVWDLNNPGAGYNTLSASGATSIVNAQAPGFVFDPVIGKFVAWSGGANVYVLDMDNLSWTLVTPASTNAVTPTAANNQGTYGRFRYIPSKNAYVVVNDIDQDVYLYKLNNTGGMSVPRAPAKPTLLIK